MNADALIKQIDQVCAEIEEKDHPTGLALQLFEQRVPEAVRQVRRWEKFSDAELEKVRVRADYHRTRFVNAMTAAREAKNAHAVYAAHRGRK